MAALVRAIAAAGPDAPVLDTVDPHRRFESAYPDVAARLHAALEAPLVTTATLLVDIAEELLFGHAAAITADTVAAVRAAIARARDAATA